MLRKRGGTQASNCASSSINSLLRLATLIPSNAVSGDVLTCTILYFLLAECGQGRVAISSGLHLGACTEFVGDELVFS
eukprot:TRINITY_DN6531_c0_g1_i1.p2 TRINITY_DN6531_c0_g1~~TRINITY_DN6531_c0_g1_i1.p2  ORF type:complete len:78 (+),score=11.47 TRINITY_DN6531_c0_g1_i1:108-341(+)